MQFSESWLRTFCNPSIPTAELAETLTMAGLEVEELKAACDAVGADLVRMVDAPISPVTIIDIYAAVAEAVRNYEPRFKISRMKVLEASADGKLTVGIEGVYFPRGHLGDYSVSEPKTVSVPL